MRAPFGDGRDADVGGVVCACDASLSHNSLHVDSFHVNYLPTGWPRLSYRNLSSYRSAIP
jgi:hypothetical protein